MSRGTAKSVMMCGRELHIGDFVRVRYTSGSGGIEGKITELWSRKRDNHLQARVANGWCFHDSDVILLYQPGEEAEDE